MSLKTNRDQLVMTAVQGTVAPAHQWAPFEVGSAGEIIAWPMRSRLPVSVMLRQRSARNLRSGQWRPRPCSWPSRRSGTSHAAIP